MTFWEAVLLVAAGIGGGLAGSVAGLASVTTYPALLLVGLPPVAANVTNTVALVFNGIGSVSGSLPELRGQRAQLKRLIPLAAIGGAAGAALLLSIPAEGFENVGGAALRGDGAVAVFGDGCSGGGGDEGGCGGDVEGATGVGAGAAGVGEGGSLRVAEWNGGGGGTHGVDEAGDFGGGGAASGERAEESGEFEVGGFAAEDGLEKLGGVGAGEVLVAFDDSFEVGL